MFDLLPQAGKLVSHHESDQHAPHVIRQLRGDVKSEHSGSQHRLSEKKENKVSD